MTDRNEDRDRQMVVLLWRLHEEGLLSVDLSKMDTDAIMRDMDFLTRDGAEDLWRATNEPDTTFPTNFEWFGRAMIQEGVENYSNRTVEDEFVLRKLCNEGWRVVKAWEEQGYQSDDI
jgi:hypothetical protein